MDSMLEVQRGVDRVNETLKMLLAENSPGFSHENTTEIYEALTELSEATQTIRDNAF